MDVSGDYETSHMSSTRDLELLIGCHTQLTGLRYCFLWVPYPVMGHGVRVHRTPLVVCCFLVPKMAQDMHVLCQPWLHACCVYAISIICQYAQQPCDYRLN